MARSDASNALLRPVDVAERLTLAYAGSAYAGWQRQTNALAVQQTVEEALSTLAGRRLRIHGAGRTDAGVHARGQVAHLLEPSGLPLRALVHGTNHHLPADVRILAAHHVPAGFHAQRSALGKEYLYRLWLGRVVPPTEAPTVAPTRGPLDDEAMREAAHRLTGRHDFSAFALAGGAHEHGRRHLWAIRLERLQSGLELRLRVFGDGFLRGMVRSLVGTLVEVGRGERSLDSVTALVAPGARRDDAGPTAEARGLTLARVVYPRRWAPVASDSD
ncbi:MAG: tRNA pseudouridine(38-40) synthase TruA [Acidobacteriota bacterium]